MSTKNRGAWNAAAAVILVIGAGCKSASLESCARGGIRKVVSDGRGFVAFTGSFGEVSGGREKVSPPEILLGRFGPS